MQIQEVESMINRVVKPQLRCLQDTVHGHIGFEDLYWQIIDTPAFKRL